MQKHKHLGWNQRSILVDWLISLHAHLQLLPETLFLTINIVDRVCSIAHGLRSDKLQLLGVTAMFIAAKYEEIWAPSVQQFAKSTDEGYEEHEITSFEIHILRLLDWNLSYPNPINFLRRATKADGYDERTRTVAKYLIEMSCVEWKMIGTRPSVVAAAGIWLARLVLNKEEWVRPTSFLTPALVNM
jgi:transcription initiation factor TFIIIB Brf1 subunit/transcription initiation factor TFIIB